LPQLLLGCVYARGEYLGIADLDEYDGRGKVERE
jgi:hypothetical protein